MGRELGNFGDFYVGLEICCLRSKAFGLCKFNLGSGRVKVH